mgnify:CR=1 FL=1
MAKLLKISRTTVERKFRFLALQAKNRQIRYMSQRSVVCDFQLDAMETYEPTKLQPLTVLLAVENKTRKILGFRVARMPAKGHLAKRSREKYGFRKDQRREARESLFEELNLQVHKRASIMSDESPHYPSSVKKYFPEASHLTVKGLRGCVVGQGELKATSNDPLFSLNHTFAMLRANINRLLRRTWCTTKIPERLEDHLHIYVDYHNTILV